jgi:hypothetical protein
MKLQFIASVAFLLLSAVPAVAAEVSSSFIFDPVLFYRLVYSLALIDVHNITVSTLTHLSYYRLSFSHAFYINYQLYILCLIIFL